MIGYIWLTGALLASGFGFLFQRNVFLSPSGKIAVLISSALVTTICAIAMLSMKPGPANRVYEDHKLRVLFLTLIVFAINAWFASRGIVGLYNDMAGVQSSWRAHAGHWHESLPNYGLCEGPSVVDEWWASACAPKSAKDTMPPGKIIFLHGDATSLGMNVESVHIQGDGVPSGN
jgi:hypothetical protein